MTIKASDPDAVTIYQADGSKAVLNIIPANGNDEFRECEPCREESQKGLFIRGLILDGEKVIGYVSADKESWELPDSVLYADEMLTDYKPSLTLYQMIDAPGYQMARQGDMITVVGTGFAPTYTEKNEPCLVSVYLNGQLVLDKVETDGQGNFKVGVELKTMPGDGVVYCVQNSPSGRLTAEKPIVVMNHDEEMEEEKYNE